MDTNELIIEALRQSLSEKVADYEVRIAQLRAQLTNLDATVTSLREALVEIQSSSPSPDAGTQENVELLVGEIVE